MLARDREHFIHLAAQTEKVNRNERADRLAIFVDQFSLDPVAILVEVAFQRSCRNVVGLWIDIDEDRGGTDAGDVTASRKICVLCSYNCVSQYDIEQHLIG